MRVDFRFIIALKFSYIFFLHVCFARIVLCKGAKAPLRPCGMFTHFFGSRFPTFLVENVWGGWKKKGGEAKLPPSSNNIRRRKDARNEMRADSTGGKMLTPASQNGYKRSVLSYKKSKTANNESATPDGKRKQRFNIGFWMKDLRIVILWKIKLPLSLDEGNF